jgi:hypothetical protein
METMKKLLLTGIAALLLATGIAHARMGFVSDINGPQVIWYRLCNMNLGEPLAYFQMDEFYTRQELTNATWCEGFVMGLVHGMTAAKEICPAVGTSSDQFLRVVMDASFKSDISEHSIPFPIFAAKALRQAWPCK